MKISKTLAPRRHQGSAVIIVLALLTIVTVYACSNARTLNSLKRQLGLIEMRQTNSPVYLHTVTFAPDGSNQPPVLSPTSLFLHE